MAIEPYHIFYRYQPDYTLMLGFVVLPQGHTFKDETTRIINRRIGPGYLPVCKTNYLTKHYHASKKDSSTHKYWNGLENTHFNDFSINTKVLTFGNRVPDPRYDSGRMIDLDAVQFHIELAKVRDRIKELA